MAKIPLHNVFEEAFGIGDIDTPEKMDALLAALDAAVEMEEAEEKAAAEKEKAEAKIPPNSAFFKERVS